MQLNGPQRGAFREALMDAFTVFTFQQMLEERIDKRYYAYAPVNADFSTMLFAVVDGANREGWIDQLVIKARETVPGNAKLAAFCLPLGLTAVRKEDRSKLEEIIRKNVAFLDVHIWLAKLSQLEYQVCRIEIPTDQGQMMYGTGFLVAPGRVLTNYHVVEAVVMGEKGKTTAEGQSAKVAQVRCRFDYMTLEGNALNTGSVYRLAENWCADLSAVEPPGPQQLDYALIRLNENPGEEPIAARPGQMGAKRGYMKLPDAEYPFPIGSPLFILQHPNAEPLKLALSTDGVAAVTADKSRVTYRTNTEPGSSGSPCFTQQLDLVALHHAGDPNYPPVPEVNEGIPMSAIRKMLLQHGLSAELG
jgi:Trypsin-like peptidase domain/Effector-associated domain 1